MERTLQRRIQLLLKSLKRESCDAFLISNFYNIFYLTGFKTLTTDEREAFVLVTKDKVYLFTDARYASNQNPNFELRLIEPKKSVLSHLSDIIAKEGIKKLGFEGEDLKYLEYQKLSGLSTQLKLRPLTNLLLTQRKIKDSSEIGAIEQACTLCDKCLVEISNVIKVGMTEKEIVFKIEYWLKAKGYDLAFAPIVAVDANSAIPHYDTKTGNGKAGPSSLILIDFGAKTDEYLSDVTRIFFMGKPGKKQQTLYQALLSTQEKTVEQIRFEKDPKAIDTFCRTKLKEEGLPDYSHSTGHGVGLEIHEYPKISFTSQDRIQNGQVVTVEPGIYLPGEFGMRIEDTVVIEDGKARILTKFPKLLRSL